MCRLLARLSVFSTIGVLGLIIGISNAAQAAGNVLLPPTSNSSGSTPLPSLGLIAPTTTDTISAPAQTPPPAPSIAAAAPVLSTSPANAPNQASVPASSPPLPATPDLQNMVTYPDDPQSASHLKPGQMPTEIIHTPDMSALLAQTDQNLPYSLTISLSSQSIYGANDIKEISSKLGLTSNQIPSACVLNVHGLIRTSKSTSMIDGGATPQAQVRYDGTIQGYMLSARASCLVNKLPPGSGLITEIGDRYQVSLQPITCAPPTRQVSQLIITYTGDNRTQCVYQ